MNTKLKKILKYFLIGLVSSFLVLFLAIAIAFNFVLTPEKITPKIVQALNENLNAELKINSVELKFFSTFPNFSLDIERVIILKQQNDSILNETYRKEDSLIAFETGRLTINPLAFLFQKKIDIEHLIIYRPRMYAHVDRNGNANWDIIKADPEKDSISSEKEKGSYQANIEIDDITISKGDLNYDDENTELYASIEGLDINLSAIFNKETILLDLEVDTDNLFLWKKGTNLIEDLSFGLAGKLDVNRSDKIVDLIQTKVRIDDIVLVANGRVIPDKQKNVLDIQLDLGLDIPSLKTIIELIPNNVLERRKNFTQEGTVSLQANISGIYGNGQFPVLQANMTVKNGCITYKKMPNKIDLIETTISVFLDPTKNKLSSVNVHNFKVKGDGIDLRMDGMVEDALGDAKITASANGTVNFASLTKIFPFKEGIVLKGDLDTDINGTFYQRDIVNKNYGNVYALGKIALTDILFTYKTDSLVFATKQSKAVFLNTEESELLTEEASKVLGGRIDLSEIKVSIKNKINASADNVFFEFGTTPWKDKTQIATMRSTMRITNAQFNLNDSVKGLIKNANAKLSLNPSVEDKSVPTVHSEFFIDSTGIIANGSFFAITDGNYNLDLIRKDKKRWPVTGQITFNKLYAYTPTFPLLLKMSKTKITIKPSLIELNHAKIELGRSDIEVSGKIYDFGKTIFEKENFKVEFAVKSNLIDANQLIATLNKGVKLRDSDIEELVTESQETNGSQITEPKSFVIPERIDFTFNSSISKVLFRDYTVNNLQGLITIKDQTIDLANLQMNTMNAKMVTKVRLTTKENDNNSLAFDFKLAEIDLANLIKLIPVLDSLMPMAKSFEGDVNFRIKGISNLNGNLGMVAPSLDAIARIEGENLVIFDSEVFSSLSKKLMFKNKETNKIDKISVEILIENKVIEVLPALVTIDRYEFAIGGKYNLDMTYDYQFSILKSPLPFKAGVDITGDNDDYKIKLTKARYKYIFSDKERHQKKVDSTLIKRKLDILRQLPF